MNGGLIFSIYKRFFNFSVERWVWGKRTPSTTSTSIFIQLVDKISRIFQCLKVCPSIHLLALGAKNPSIKRFEVLLCVQYWIRPISSLQDIVEHTHALYNKVAICTCWTNFKKPITQQQDLYAKPKNPTISILFPKLYTGCQYNSTSCSI